MYHFELQELPAYPAAMRRAGTTYHLQDNTLLRNAIGARRPEGVKMALDGWIIKDVRLKTLPLPAQPKGQWLGWLPWAAWVETHHSTGPEFPENTPSSGVLEVLVKHGMFDWNAMRQFPSRRWKDNSGFKALEKACLDRMARLPRSHRLILEAHSSTAPSPHPPGHPQDWNDRGDPTWLDLAVNARRLDVVQRWIRLDGPVLGVGSSFRSAWYNAWYGALNDGVAMAQGRLDPAQETVSLRTASLLEAAILNVTPLTFRSSWKQPDAAIRDEVLNLIGLAYDSLHESHLNHAPTRDALVATIQRTFARVPFDLAPQEYDHVRVKKPDDPFVRSVLADLERTTLQQTLADVPATTPILALPRRRL